MGSGLPRARPGAGSERGGEVACGQAAPRRRAVLGSSTSVRPPARVHLASSFASAPFRSPLGGRSPRPSLRGLGLQNLVSTSSRSASRSFAILSGRERAGGFHGNEGARRARPPVCVPCACANRPPPRDASRRGADVLALAAAQGSWVGAGAVVCSRGWVPWAQPVPAALPSASVQPVGPSLSSSLPLRYLTPIPGLNPRPVPTPGHFPRL